MSERQPVRVPLQSGATAWKASVAVALRLIPGIALLVWLTWWMYNLMLSHEIAIGTFSYVPRPVALLIYLFGGTVSIVLIASSIEMRPLARSTLPSDLLITTEGFRVEGGPHHGMSVSWRDVYELKLEKRASPALTGLFAFFRPRAKQPDLVELRVAVKGGTIVATALEPEEQRALASIAALMAQAISEVHEGELPPQLLNGDIERPVKADAALQANALVCPSCKSAVAPEDEAAVTCGKCNASVDVPASIREKVRAAYALPALRAKGQSGIRRMLQSPHAGTASVAVRVLGIAMTWMWVIVFAATIVAAVKHRIRLDGVAVLLVGAGVLAIIALVDHVLRPLFVARQAHPVAVVDFSARAAAFPDGPLRCRTCDAALPTRFDGHIARCMACASDNVLALDLSREVPLLRRQSAALDTEMASWRRRRNRTYAVAVVAAICALGLGRLAVSRFRFDPYHSKIEKGCEAGDADDCQAVAVSLSLKGKYMGAYEVLDKACDPASNNLDVAGACRDLARMLSDGWQHSQHKDWPQLDLVRAESLYAGACRLGDKLACDLRPLLCELPNAPPACSSSK